MSTEQEEAIKLILRGHRFKHDVESCEDEHRRITKYFQSIDAEDLNAAIADFEYSSDPDERRDASKLLIAYFRWCWQVGKDSLSGHQIDVFVATFAKAAFLRIAGAELVSGSGDEGELLPEWRRPDTAFGLEKSNHRPSEGSKERNITIAMCLELLRREGVERSAAKQRASSMFGVSADTIAKAITLGNSDEVSHVYGKKFSLFTKDELKSVVDDFISIEKQEKTTP